MTYRVGDHSTSDHSVLYRTEEEINSWKIGNNPINRLGLYLNKYSNIPLDENLEKRIKKVNFQIIFIYKTGNQRQNC